MARSKEACDSATMSGAARKGVSVRLALAAEVSAKCQPLMRSAWSGVRGSEWVHDSRVGLRAHG
jgi:hypothetical protein